MNILSLIAIAYSFELGAANGDFALWEYQNNAIEKTAKSKSIYTNLGIKLNFWNLYVGGNIQTPVINDNNNHKLRPLKEDFSFSSGFKRKWFEFGYEHFCTHPIVAYAPDLIVKYKREGAYDKLFVRVSHEFHPFN